MGPPPHRVLVVDDEPNIVDVISMALRFQGFEVESAGTGAQAISAARVFKPDLILLDVMLPDMEGFDVAQWLGAQRNRVPIVFLTARDATGDKVRGLSIGGDAYVTKPFSLEELVARIRSVLRRTVWRRPTRVPRSGAWGSPSTGCWTGSSRPSTSVRGPRNACGAS